MTEITDLAVAVGRVDGKTDVIVTNQAQIQGCQGEIKSLLTQHQGAISGVVEWTEGHERLHGNDLAHKDRSIKVLAILVTLLGTLAACLGYTTF